MASTSSLGSVPEPARTDTLAAALAEGPLPLCEALSYAVRIASQLRELHAGGHAHGAVSAEQIVVAPGRVELLPAGPGADRHDMVGDIRGWGAVLYEMLTGALAPAGPQPGAAEAPEPANGPSAVRPAALRLAVRCLAAPAETTPGIQRVLSEMRVLAVLARQYGFRPPAAHRLPPEPPPAPFLVLPPQPVSDGTALPVNRRAAMLARLVDSAFPPVAASLPEQAATPGEAPAAVPGPVELDTATQSGQPSAPVAAEPAPQGTGPCPRCAGTAIYISRPRSGFERRLEGWGIPLCRCHRCYHRWVVVASLRIAKAMPAAAGAGNVVKKRK